MGCSGCKDKENRRQRSSRPSPDTDGELSRGATEAKLRFAKRELKRLQDEEKIAQKRAASLEARLKQLTEKRQSAEDNVNRLVALKKKMSPDSPFKNI